MKDILTKISLTTATLAYLFSCGTIYLVAYWSTFELDVTNYIDLLDIPKSFVFPLASGIGVSFISIIIQGVAHASQKMRRDEQINSELLPKIEELPTKTLLKRIIIDYDFWVMCILIVCILFHRPEREWVYAVLSIVLIVYGVAKFIRNKNIVEWIPNSRIRLFAAILFFFR